MSNLEKLRDEILEVNKSIEEQYLIIEKAIKAIERLSKLTDKFKK